MSVSVARRLRDGVLSIGSVSALVAGMAAIDETVRGGLSDLLNGRLPVAITVPDLGIQHMTGMVTGALGLSASNQFALLGFGLGGVVLFVLMIRS